MLDSESSYTVDTVNDDLLDDNNTSLESFSLDESISTSSDLSVLLKKEEQYLLKDRLNFDTVSVNLNSQNLNSQQSFSWSGNELSNSKNFSSQKFLAANLSSETIFAATDTNIFNYTQNSSFGTAQTVYLGHFQGTLGADKFTYTLGAGAEFAVISGNGNIEYGSGYYDSIDFSNISVNQVTDYSFAEIGSGGTIFNTGNGDRVFDYITLDNGSKILLEGIDKITFSDYEVDLTVDPNDTEYLNQWNLHMMGVQNAWRFTTGSDDVLVGVQDTGLGVINGNIHQDLRADETWFYNNGNGLNGNLSDDFYTEGRQQSETSSHGTAVQGIIAADTNNGLGIAGINWNSDVYNIDVLGGNTGDLSLVEATQIMINRANSQGQRLIVNMSLGTSSFGSNYHSDLEQLVANNQDNALFVIAAGNSGHLGQAGLASPAVLAQSYDNVIAVGASWGSYDYYGYKTKLGQRIEYNNWWGSQYGSGLTLMGPSEVSTTSAYRYYSDFLSGFSYDDDFNGTSAAAPNVAGVASLVWSANSNLSATQIKDILSETAYDLGNEGYDLFYGHGFVNADAAVRRAMALSYTDSLTGASSNNSFSTVSANSYEQSYNEVDRFTGNNYTNQSALAEDSLVFTQQISGASYSELIDDTSISLGIANSNEMMTALKDSFLETSGYDAQFAVSNNLGEDNIFYNTVEI